MSFTKGNSSSTIKDPDTGDKAKVDAKTTGELGLHVKASLDAGTVVTTIPPAVGERYYELFTNGGSNSMMVDGSVTPVVFTVPLDASKIIYVAQIRMFGGGNGIKYGKFLSQNGPLTNGILIEWKANNITKSLPAIKTTEAFKNLFTFPGASNFRIDVQSGEDQFLSVLQFDVPLELHPTGTYSPDDYIKITIRDNLTSNLSSIKALAFGREQA